MALRRSCKSALNDLLISLNKVSVNRAWSKGFANEMLTIIHNKVRLIQLLPLFGLQGRSAATRAAFLYQNQVPVLLKFLGFLVNEIR